MCVCVCVCVCGGGQRVNIIVSGHQMPAGRGTKGIDGEWVEQLLLFIAEPTEKVSAIKEAHRAGFMQIHVGLQPYKLTLLLNTHTRSLRPASKHTFSISVFHTHKNVNMFVQLLKQLHQQQNLVKLV